MRKRSISFLLAILMSMTGIQTFAYDALVDGIKRLGGQVVCHAEVNELVEKEGRWRMK